MKLAIVTTKEIEVGDRVRKDYGDIDKLIASLKDSGIIQPISVVAQNEEGKRPYLLLGGGRRLAACIKAGITEIPIRIYDKLNKYEIRMIELQENLQRKQLTWAEEVAAKKAINQLHKDLYGEKVSPSPNALGWSNADTAKLLDIHKTGLSQDLKLAEAVEVMPDLAKLKSKSEATKVLKALGNDWQKEQSAAKLKELKATTPQDVMRKQLIDGYLVDDARKFANFPDETFDLIELDSPFAINVKAVKREEVQGLTTRNYNEWKAAEYVERTKEMINLAYQKLKPTGWLLVWFAPDPWWNFNRMVIKKAGFKFRAAPCIWTKGSGQTNRPELYFASTFEYFFYAGKEASQIAKRGRANEFEFKPVSPKRKIHATEKPVELMQEIYSCFCNTPEQMVGIPYLGSGNGKLAAANLGLDSIGFDLYKQNKDNFIVKVFEGEPSLYRSYKLED